MDVSAMEVGVVDDILDDFRVPASIDFLPGLDQGSEQDPVVLVESLDLELKMLKRSLPVAHERVVFVLQLSCPIMDANPVKDQNEVIVDTVDRAISLSDIDMLCCDGRCDNFILLNDLFSRRCCSVLLCECKGSR